MSLGPGPLVPIPNPMKLALERLPVLVAPEQELLVRILRVQLRAFRQLRCADVRDVRVIEGFALVRDVDASACCDLLAVQDLERALTSGGRRRILQVLEGLTVLAKVFNPKNRNGSSENRPHERDIAWQTVLGSYYSLTMGLTSP